jgi:hypothetical protein
MALRFFVIAAAIILLAAIATCSLAPSPNMREMWWIPAWLGEWADRNPNFRNMPVFAALSVLLSFVWNLLSPISDIRRLTSAKSLSLLVSSPVVRGPVVLRRAALCFCAAALLGASLEALQLLLSNRHFDWADIGWSTSGAFAGAFVAWSISMLSAPRTMLSAC